MLIRFHTDAGVSYSPM